MVANTKTIATKNNISVRKTPIGRKSATAAVLLAYIFSVCLLKILAEFSEYFLSHHGHYFWVILNSITTVATLVVIIILHYIYIECGKYEEHIVMANSLKVEMYSESFALTAEICGLVLSIIRAVSTPNEVLIDFLLAIEYTALPCVTLALALVIKRLFGMITLHATR